MERVNRTDPLRKKISDFFEPEVWEVMSEFIMQANQLLSPKVIMALVRNTGIGELPPVNNDANPLYIYKLCLTMAEILLSEDFHNYQRLIAAKFIDLIAKVTQDVPALSPEEVGGIDKTIEEVISGNVANIFYWKSLSSGEKRAFYYIARDLHYDLLKTDIVPVPVGMKMKDLETLIRYVKGGMPKFVGKRIYDSLRKGDGSFNSAYYRAAYSFLSQCVYNESRGDTTEVMKEKLRKMHSVEPQLPQESDRDYVERCCLQQQQAAGKPKKQAGYLYHSARLSAKGLPQQASHTSSLQDLLQSPEKT